MRRRERLGDCGSRPGPTVGRVSRSDRGVTYATRRGHSAKPHLAVTDIHTPGTMEGL